MRNYITKSKRSMRPAQFTGWAFSPGMEVSYYHKRHNVPITGYVTQLLMRHAEVFNAIDETVKVPYDSLIPKSNLDAAMTGREVERFFESNLKRWDDGNISDYELMVSFGHKSSLGVCDFVERKIYIAVSAIQLLPEANIKEIILHEIAHALAGYDAGHGPEWQSIARRVGSNGSREAEASVESIVRTRLKGKSPTGTHKDAAKAFEKAQDFLNTLGISSIRDELREAGFSYKGYNDVVFKEVAFNLKSGMLASKVELAAYVELLEFISDLLVNQVEVFSFNGRDLVPLRKMYNAMRRDVVKIADATEK